MPNPYPFEIVSGGSVRQAGNLTFTDSGNQPGGSSAPLQFGFWGIYNTGPYGGVDDFIPLTAFGPELSDPDYAMTAQTSFGFPITIGAGGGFALYCRIPSAFAAAHPNLTFYCEIAVSNLDGTQKLDVVAERSPGVFLPFIDIPGFFAVPDLTNLTWGVIEQIGSDLSNSVFNDFYDTGKGAPAIFSAAGGQLFAAGWIDLRGITT